MTSIRFVFLDYQRGWPSERRGCRRVSTFRAKYSQTLYLLTTELQAVRARDVVIEAGFRRVRQDGWPYSSDRPEHAAVILSFTAPAAGPLSFPCDQYKTFDDNLRAIALSMQALRAVDRYGVTRDAEQYRGWAALPAPAVSPAEQANTDLLAIARISGLAPCDVKANFAEARRQALRRAHPDAGGTHDVFCAVQAAIERLESKADGK